MVFGSLGKHLIPHLKAFISITHLSDYTHFGFISHGILHKRKRIFKIYVHFNNHFGMKIKNIAAHWKSNLYVLSALSFDCLESERVFFVCDSNATFAGMSAKNDKIKWSHCTLKLEFMELRIWEAQFLYNDNARKSGYQLV